MIYLRTFMRRVLPYCFTAACWLALAGPAWAQQEGGTERSASPWVLPYALVIFAIGLGLLIVCKPSRRRDKAKIEQ